MTEVRVPAATGRPEDAADGLSQLPASPGPAPRRGGRGPFGVLDWARWGWRQLTSMRTALILLFLLALGSVPGSVLPQQGINPQAVQQYYAAHPALAPWLARFSLFNVFAAPWFAAIYLLLFLSLAGCVVPRTFRQFGAARQQPPRAPRNLSRLPLSVTMASPLAPDAALAKASALLAGKRFRVRTGDGWVSAEKGYLREAGNLLFHLALLALLAAIGMGGLFGYKADRLLVAGQSFANTVTALDQFRPGRLVSASGLQPFSIALEKFNARYVTSGPDTGEPAAFNAYLSYRAQPAGPTQHYDLQVNHPLNVDNVKVYLIGHGYAPVFRVTDGTGHVVFDGPVPFIPVSLNGLTSEGVVKVPDARPQQLGFAGVFLPTTVATSVTGFGFPFDHLLPSHVVGVISLVVLAVAIAARYALQLRGAWRRVYVICALLALYLNVFVGVVQSFLKIRQTIAALNRIPIESASIIGNEDLEMIARLGHLQLDFGCRCVPEART